MNTCPYCGAAIEEAERCPRCGADPHETACPNCGRPLREGQVCPHCADMAARDPKAAAEPQPGAAAPQGANAPLTTWAYMGLFLLWAIPVVGFVAMLILACGVGSNRNTTHFARGALLARLAIVLLVLIVCLILASQIVPYILPGIMNAAPYWW